MGHPERSEESLHKGWVNASILSIPFFQEEGYTIGLIVYKNINFFKIAKNRQFITKSKK
jgi:hypothetical protein